MFDHDKAQPVVISTLEVSASLKWTLHVHSVRIEASSMPMLSILPTSIESASGVVRTLSAVNNSQFCQGNEFEKFADVIVARNGSLRDSQGMYMYMYMFV